MPQSFHLFLAPIHDIVNVALRNSCPQKGKLARGHATNVALQNSGLQKGKLAQMALEYVILLSIALSVGIIILVLSGFFPSFTYSAQMSDSNRYWSGGASPIAIIDFKQTDDQLLVIAENKASANIQIPSFRLMLGSSAYYNNIGISIPSGGKTTISFITQSCSPRKTFPYDVLINYGTDDVSGLVQTGLKPLYVTCSN